MTPRRFLEKNKNERSEFNIFETQGLGATVDLNIFETQVLRAILLLQPPFPYT